MTEGESRRDGGGGEGGRERISRAHFAHASLHKPTVNLCFKAGDLLLQLSHFSRRLEENMSKITEIKSKQEDLECRTLLTSGRKMLEC